ncbi:hypothetical protein RC74_08410 [Falsihalocynthiibacter arcticus]|uniref:Uncharacterized protein n=1 Tax=Falsihalocynthiibacter arcticus TaxID=1579316 RepID=A0A126UYX3_9RHOB|nr:hypothetical protein RC74_08410 [Falsihalocynthiibacter arcticus]
MGPAQTGPFFLAILIPNLYRNIRPISRQEEPHLTKIEAWILKVEAKMEVSKTYRDDAYRFK